MADESNEVDEYRLNKMLVGDETQLKCVAAYTSLLVRRVPTGWLYTYVRAVVAGGDLKNEVMTTTFVPEQ